MIQKVLLPVLGETMREATIAKWHVRVGDAVRKGQVILEITTDKATLEVESQATGTVRHILAQENEVVPVNDTIAIVADPDEPIPAEALKRGAPRPVSSMAQPTAAVAPAALSRPAPLSSPGAAASSAATMAIEVEAVPLESGLLAPGKKNATPRAKALARQLDIPILAVDGSGPGGRVHERDVRAYHDLIKGIRFTPAARQMAVERQVDLRQFIGRSERIAEEDIQKAPAMSGGVPEPLNAMRSTIARRMTQSKLAAPHFYLTTNVDMTAAQELRLKLKKEGARISINDMIIKACGLALRRFPRVASVYTPHGYIRRDRMHVGFAVALDNEGLVVPVVRDVDRRTLAEIAADTKALIDKARANRLTVDDYSGGVFTVSNLGTFDVDHFTAIINPGESAILAVGKIVEKPVVLKGEIVIRPMMNITLSSDHRTIDGVLAARFAGCVKELLEKPEALTT